MNLYSPVQMILKGLLYLIALPFLVVGMTLKFLMILISGVLSFALVAMSFVVVLMAFWAVLVCPWFRYSPHSEFLYQDTPGLVTAFPALASNAGQRDESRRFVVIPSKLRELSPTPRAEVEERDFEAEETEDESPSENQADVEDVEDGDASHVRPEWVDGEEYQIAPSGLETIRVESGPCDSAAAAQVALARAVRNAAERYWRERVEVLMRDFHLRFLPGYESFLRGAMRRLHLSPQQEFLHVQKTTIGDQTVQTYFKYGLLEVSPALRESVDRTVVCWGRSFQAASLWTGLLGIMACSYLLLRLNLLRYWTAGSPWQRWTLAGGITLVLVGFLGAAFALW